jgi:dUTP pyrophosphatase
MKILNKSEFEMPGYAKSGDAGMDLRANIHQQKIQRIIYSDDEQVHQMYLPYKGLNINPMERVLIPTGIHVKLTEGCQAEIRARSGLAFKKGLTVINSPGTIDENYTGEIMIPIVNLSGTTQYIEHGERIAQMVVMPYVEVAFHPVESEEQLGKTERGSGGFGSTGEK